jgi:xanthine phosphoribosyltransferase
MELLKLGWAEIEFLVRTLCVQLRRQVHPIQRIYALPRGGLVPATLIAHELGIQSVKIPSPVTFPRAFRPAEGVLIVDDIADSGKTLRFAKRDYIGAKFACLVARSKCEPKPDFVGQILDTDAWVWFPWEIDPERDQKEYREKQ